jgi:uncharacterized protein (DUF305 family)
MTARLAGQPGAGPYDPQQNPDRGKETDLERLSRVHGTGIDRAFLKVMTARHWAGLRMATAEVCDGVVSEVRMLAKEMRAQLQTQIRQMTMMLRT